MIKVKTGAEQASFQLFLTVLSLHIKHEQHQLG